MNELVAKMLEDYSERLSNNGCNDLILENTEENRALVQAAIDWNGDDQCKIEPYLQGDKIYFFDYWMAGYLASTFREAK